MYRIALPQTHEALSPKELQVGFVYVSPVGDAGYSYAHDQGRLAVEAMDGVTTVESVAEGQDSERVIMNMARKGMTSSSPPATATWTPCSRSPNIVLRSVTSTPFSAAFFRLKLDFTSCSRFKDSSHLQQKRQSSDSSPPKLNPLRLRCALADQSAAIHDLAPAPSGIRVRAPAADRVLAWIVCW